MRKKRRTIFNSQEPKFKSISNEELFKKISEDNEVNIMGNDLLHSIVTYNNDSVQSVSNISHKRLHQATPDSKDDIVLMKSSASKTSKIDLSSQSENTTTTSRHKCIISKSLTEKSQETVKNNKEVIQIAGKINFEAFADPTKFEQRINLENKTMIECMNEYTKYKSMSMDEAHVKNQFRSLFKYIKLIETEFNITIYPVVVGTMFMTQFESYLITKGLSPGTIAGLCNSLKAIVKWSALYGSKIAIDIDQFKIKVQESKPKVYLSDEEIVRIYYFDIDSIKARPQLKRTLAKVRDHFVLSCFIGQRYSDTLRITPNNFHGAAKDTFQTIQLKTGNSAILNFDRIYGRYPKIVKEILEKYKYTAPWSGHLSNYNHYLHLLCKMVGLDEEIKFEYKIKNVIHEKTYKKYELISSHVARRSFITNAVNRGINNSVTKKASGHISDSSFNRYVLLENDYKK